MLTFIKNWFNGVVLYLTLRNTDKMLEAVDAMVNQERELTDEELDEILDSL